MILVVRVPEIDSITRVVLLYVEINDVTGLLLDAVPEADGRVIVTVSLCPAPRRTSSNPRSTLGGSPALEGKCRYSCGICARRASAPTGSDLTRRGAYLATSDAPGVFYCERDPERRPVQPECGRTSFTGGAHFACGPFCLEGCERVVRAVECADLEVRVGKVRIRKAEPEFEPGLDVVLHEG